VAFETGISWLPSETLIHLLVVPTHLSTTTAIKNKFST